MSSAPAVYRQLLRAVSVGFKNDIFAMASARQEIRKSFQEFAGVRDPTEIQTILAAGSETADFIRTCIVQGVTTDKGSVGVTLQAHHAGGVLEPPAAAISTAKPDDPDACYTG